MAEGQAKRSAALLVIGSIVDVSDGSVQATWMWPQGWA